MKTKDCLCAVLCTKTAILGFMLMFPKWFQLFILTRLKKIWFKLICVRKYCSGFILKDVGYHSFCSCFFFLETFCVNCMDFLENKELLILFFKKKFILFLQKETKIVCQLLTDVFDHLFVSKMIYRFIYCYESHIGKIKNKEWVKCLLKNSQQICNLPRSVWLNKKDRKRNGSME